MANTGQASNELVSIFSARSNRLGDGMWKHKQREILRALLHEGFLDKVIGNASDSEKMLSRSRKANKLDQALLMNLKKRIHPGHAKTACDIFLTKKLADFNKESLEPWISLIILHCIGLSTEMPEGTFPAEDELLEALDDESSCGALVEKMSPFLPYAAALAELEEFSFALRTYLERIAKINSSLATQKIETLEEAVAANKLIHEARAQHRFFLNGMRSIRASFDSLQIVDETVPELSACLVNSGMALALALRKNLDAIKEELRGACLNRLPAKFDTGSLLNLVDCITPPFSPADMSLAKNEIAKLAEGAIAAEASPLLAVIIPAINGEREIDDEWLYEAFPNFPYSGSLVLKLKKGAFSLKEDAGDTEGKAASAMEPEPSQAPGQETTQKIPEEAPAADGPEFKTTSEEACGAGNGHMIELVIGGNASFDPDHASGKETESGNDACIDEKINPGPDSSADDCAKTGLFEDSIPKHAEPLDQASAALDEASQNLSQDGQENPGPLPEISDGKEADGQASRERAAGALNPDEQDSGMEPVKKPGKSQKPSAIQQAATLSASIDQIINGAPLDLPRTTETDINALAQGLIEARESCALYWLARTIDDEAVGPAWLYRLLHLGTRYQAKMVSACSEISALCAMAAERMEELGEKQKLLLATAILRPALLMPEQPMITIASFLSSNLNERYGLKPFMDELLTFMRSGKALDDLASSDMAPQARRQQQDRLVEETDRLLMLALKGKTSYQPATALKLKLFRKDGKIGKLLHACKKGSINEIRAALLHYEDERNIKALIESNIEAKARESILKDVRLALKLAREWLSFHESDRKDELTFAEARLDRLNAIMDNLRRQLDSCPEGIWLAHAMDNLYARTQQGPVSPVMELELWPLRLPCSSPAAEPIFEKDVLLSSLLARDFADSGAIASSLAIHAACGRITQVREFLDCFPEFRDESLSRQYLERSAPMLAEAFPFTLDEMLDVSARLWAEAFDRELGKLKEYLGDSYFRGAILYDQQSRINAEITEIVARCSEIPDKVQGIQDLRKLHSELMDCDKCILDAVNVRIGELERGAATREAKSFLAALKEEVAASHVFSAAWDNIARLERYLLEPGELPKLDHQKSSTLVAAREFYNTDPACWKDKADRESARLWTRLCGLNFRGRFDERAFLGITTELQRWLGFVLPSGAHPEEVFSDARPNHWRVRRYEMTINSPLPQWGSAARGRHTIAFGWNVTPTNISNLITSGRFKPGEALTIVCCCALSLEQRREMLRLSHKWKVFPLVIDESLFHYLAAQDEASRTEKLFEVALAGSSCNPYTPEVAGAVPREMFFGRENDKNSVFSTTTGSCIIYGGRQLGKSALLEQIYQDGRSEKSPDIKVIKYPMTVHDTSLLDVVIRNCVDAGVIHPNTSRNTFNANIKKWLDEKGGRRVLVLLDECDRILDEDSRREFRDVWILRNIMQETSHNFKVVFTGLHSVQRFSLVPNNPLYHFGTNICIGPLSTDAAYDLMTRPMQCLGLEFEDPQLVQMALNYCNYQPKLIQMFCSELVKGINRLSPREPVHIIDKSTMLKVYDSQDLKTRIRECFLMTVSLDTRYLVIGYTMALLQGEKISIRELQRDLRNYWPAAFEGPGGDIITLQSLLHEMEGLGLIISLGGSYRLRTPNIAELLGGVENVLLELEQFYDKPYQPVADPDELRMEEASSLVASQYNLLVDKTSRLCWISGSRALGLEKMPEALRIITEKTSSTYRGKTTHTVIAGSTVEEAMKSLTASYEDIREGGLIASISSSSFPFMAEFMESAEAWLGRLRTDRKYVKVVCLVHPDCLNQFISEGTADRFSSYQIALRPWTRNSVEHWRKAKTLVDWDADDIMARTGGWPVLIEPLLDGSANAGIAENLAPADLVPDDPGILHIIKGLDALDGVPCPESDLGGLVGMPDGMDEDEFQNRVESLKCLHILRETPDGLALEGIAAKTICGHA